MRTSTLFYSLTGQLVGCSGIQASNQYLINKAFPREPMNIVANLAIQSANGNNAPDDNTPFPSSLEIDYIRYYKQIECNDLVVLTNADESMLSPRVFNVIMANRIVVNADFDLTSDQQLSLIARDEIEMSPDFFPDLGSEFSAEINPDICDYDGMGLANGSDPVVQVAERKMEVNTEKERKIALNSSNLVEISPNPTSEKSFYLRLHETYRQQNVLVELRDVSGSVVYHNQVEKDKKIEVPHLSTGMYFIQVLDERGNCLLLDKLLVD